MDFSMTYYDNEVTSRAGRAAGAAAYVLILLPLIIISLPLHYVLRGLGRQGFIARGQGEVSYDLSSAGFRRAA